MVVLILLQSAEGGTNVLLNRFAEWLINKGFDVIRQKPGLDWVEAVKCDLVVLPTSEIASYESFRKHIECDNVLIWCMGSRALSGAFYSHTSKNKIIKLYGALIGVYVNFFLRSLLSHGAIIFTDEVGFYSEFNGLGGSRDISELIYPIPISVQNKKNVKRFDNFVWVGRIDDDFKIYPLLRLVSDFEASRKNGIVANDSILKIIGDGNAVHVLKRHIAVENIENVELLGSMPHAELKSYIYEHADLLVGMGTSVLEGASFGVPALIVNPYFSMSDVSYNTYRWIGETKGYSLGEFPNYDHKPAQVKKSFDEALKGVNINKVADESYRFAKKFDQERVFEKLLKRNPSKPFNSRLLSYFKYVFFINKCKKLLKG